MTQPTSRPEGQGGFRVTGRFVLIAMVLFFGVIFAMNAVFVTFAVRTFPGLSTDEPFRRGLARNFNAEQADRVEQATRGWTTTVLEAPRANAPGRVLIEMTAADGAALDALSVDGMLARMVEAASDQALVFTPVGDGRYVADVEALAPGDWMLTLHTTFPDGAPFEAQRRLLIE